MLKSFTELQVWQKAHTLTLDVYRATAKFPDHERFGIVAQLRRASSSIPGNIAEGFGRRTTREFLQSLAVANGSLQETRYFLILGRDLHYLLADEYASLDSQCEVVGRMLTALARSLRERDHKPRLTSRQSRVANRP
jgi:four helix bundle protein